MKKRIVVLLIVISVTILFGCRAKDNTDVNNGHQSNVDSSGSTTPAVNTGSISTPSAEVLHIKDYFPIEKDIRYTYEGKGNEYASFNVYNDYVSDDRIQQRVDNGGTVAAKVIELKDGRMTRVLSKGEVYYRENLLKTAGEDKEILLMEPLKKGTAWTLKNSAVRKITDTEADVSTPLGKYKAIEVTTEGKDNKVIDYYVKDIGLVKTSYTSGSFEVTSSLSKIERNSALVQKVRFYYPNINDEKLYFETKNISFKTNDVTKQVLEKAYKDIATAKIGNTFTTNTKINSLYLNKDNMVYIDLTKAFQTEMNAGAKYEQIILQCIANTFGSYYNAEKVILTVDSKPYKSGHISMKKGEYIKVNFDNSVEFKE